MLTYGLKLEAWLRRVPELYRTGPEYVCGVDSPVRFCFVDLAILFYYFEMHPGDVFGVGALHFH